MQGSWQMPSRHNEQSLSAVPSRLAVRGSPDPALQTDRRSPERKAASRCLPPKQQKNVWARAPRSKVHLNGYDSKGSVLTFSRQANKRRRAAAIASRWRQS